MPVRKARRKPLWFNGFGAALSTLGLLLGLWLGGMAGVAAAPAGKPVADKGKRGHAGKTPKAAVVPKGLVGKTSPVKRIARNAHLHRALRAHVEKQQTSASDGSILGAASFYGYGFQGRKSASGESFDVKSYTAATNRFPIGSWLAVRRLDNNRCVVVRVNDRMDTRHHLRVIDISRTAAERLRMVMDGVILVRVKKLPEAPPEAEHGRCPEEMRPPVPVCAGCFAVVPDADDENTDFMLP